ncbi:MAG: SDR family oxidoreductase [Bacteroidales bacterium]|nr:SDR family oxidoreductase [Bacteroidales bacterium]
MEDKILVTGGTGTIGSMLVNMLQEAGVPFRVMVRDAKKATALNGRGIETVVGDFTDLSTLPAALEGCRKLFLLSVSSPEQGIWQSGMIRIAKDRGIRHIVKLSAMGAGIDAPTTLGRQHGIAEDALKSSGMGWTILQPHSFMQNLFGDAATIRAQGLIYSPLGTGRIGMVDARDIAAVTFHALTEPGHTGKTYILTGPEAISMEDVARAISQATGKNVKYHPISHDQSRQGMTDAGLPGWLVDDLTLLNRLFSENKGSTLSPDVERVTGRKPGSIERFAADHADRFI